MTTYPTTLYETPETWSNITMFLTREKANVIIDWLAGREDITEPIVDDMREWTLETDFDNCALYTNVSNGDELYIAVARTAKGQYELVGGQWLNGIDAVSDIENGTMEIDVAFPLPGTWKRLGNN